MNSLRRQHPWLDELGAGRIPGAVWLDALLRLASAGSVLVAPVIAASAAQALFGGDSEAAAWQALLLLGVLAIRLAMEFCATLVSTRARFRLVARMRNRLFERAQRATLASHDASRRPVWVAAFSYDVPRVVDSIVEVPPGALQALVTAAGAIAAMAWIDPRLAAVVVAGGVPLFFVVRSLARRARALAERYWSTEVEGVSLVDETLAGILAVKAFGQTASRARTYAEVNQRLTATGLAQTRFYAALGPIAQLVTLSGIVTLVFLSAHALDAPPSPTELASIVLYGSVLGLGLRGMFDAWSSVQNASSAAGRISEIVGAPQERAGGLRPTECKGRLTLRGVSFAHPDKDRCLDAASLVVHAGETVLLSGDNGAGKSTAAAMLLGFVHPQEGTVLLDDNDLETLDLEWLRTVVTIVPQEPLLFAGSIRENILFARPDATEEELAAACHAALVDEVAASLPEGLLTQIGEDGALLSGGQRQRIGIARAILADTPVLILDEATSMLDAGARNRLIDRNSRRFEKRTVLWITHRPDEARANADRLVELAGGTFVARPTAVEAAG